MIIANPIRAVILDLDGTLMDTACEIDSALSRTFGELGIAPLDRRAVEALIGRGVRSLVERALAGRGASANVDKAVESFAQCFVAAQDRTSGAWSFVPKESGGGTFSNLGARGVHHPYFLEVADRGGVREIRLSSAAANRSVMQAVDGCI